MVAAKAYEAMNKILAQDNLEIRFPKTISDVEKHEVQAYVEAFGWRAVVKIPYSNAGQGVYTITSKKEFEVCTDLCCEIDVLMWCDVM